MSTAAGTREPSKILEELVGAFGSEKVLSDPEDLYVYSFHGEFAIRRREAPLAVLRLSTEGGMRELDMIIEGSEIRVARNDVDLKEEPRGPDAPLLLVDAREPISPATLRERLSELEKAQRRGKGKLRGDLPFPEWLVSSLKLRDGYRIGERPGCDDGFCAVQPFFDGIETFSSKGRLLLTRGLLKGELEATERLADSIYTCTACGQCYDQMSLLGLEMNKAIIRTRHEIVKAGLSPKQCGELSSNILCEGNPMGMPAEDRALWYEELADGSPYEGNDVLYWTGCSTSYRLPGVVEATAKTFEEANLDFGLMGEEEGCCGLILYLLGLWDEARENAMKTLGALADRGVKRLVTGCAGCYYAFTRVYPFLNMRPRFQVSHTSQVLESLILDGRLQPKGLSGSFMWHDPCDLGRHSNVFEPPRNVLRAIPGLELKELPLNRQHAICCGGGGGLMMYDISLSERIALSKVVEEISPLGLDGVVTGCPACILSLRSAAKEIGSELPVYDLAELVGRCL
jgi:Fe-S oxidoreductase